MTGEQDFEERFGFKARGEFRCQGWFEIPVTILGLLMIIPGYFVAKYLMSYALLGVLGLLVFIPVWGIIMWWIVRVGHTGVTYRYEADDNEFRITAPKNTETLYYKDIAAVNYKPKYFLNRKIRGYKVTISTRYRSLVYKYIFPGGKVNQSPENTPFFILEKRAGLVQGVIPEGGAGRT